MLFAGQRHSHFIPLDNPLISPPHHWLLSLCRSFNVARMRLLDAAGSRVTSAAAAAAKEVSYAYDLRGSLVRRVSVSLTISLAAKYLCLILHSPLIRLDPRTFFPTFPRRDGLSSQPWKSRSPKPKPTATRAGRCRAQSMPGVGLST